MSSNYITSLVEKTMLWRGNSWWKYDSKGPLNLRIHYDQLILSSGDKILENINLNTKVKGFYKDNVIILIVNDSSQGIRKVKLMVKDNIAEILQHLSQFLPIINYKAINDKSVRSQYQNINEIYDLALKSIAEGEGTNNPPPSQLENFVKICLLDPNFSEFVKNTQDILNKLES